MTELGSLHGRLGFIIMALAIVATAWGVRGIIRRQIEPGVRPYLYLLEALVLLEALAGLTVATVGHQHPQDVLHWLYGILASISIPIAILFAHTSTARKEAIVVTLGPFALFLFCVRTAMTGG